MNKPMPPCFDCGKKIEKGNVWKATDEEISSNPNYDFRSGLGSDLVTVCDSCDSKRILKDECKKLNRPLLNDG